MSELIEKEAMFKLSYGLFVLTARTNGKDNGCIINTVTQITDSPKQIMIAVNKSNLTEQMISESGIFNVSVLTVKTPFSVFERFGFASGRDKDKFDGFSCAARTENGLLRLTSSSNAFMSAKVVNKIDCGTHTMFVAEITEAKVLSGEESVTYDYYFKHIKPKPASTAKKSGYICKICGYVHEGDELPADFICPICKHGAEDFEPLSAESVEVAKPEASANAGEGDVYVCSICGYTYKVAEGDAKNGIAPGTKFEDLPDSFVCPMCCADKCVFEKIN